MTVMARQVAVHYKDCPCGTSAFNLNTSFNKGEVTCKKCISIITPNDQTFVIANRKGQSTLADINSERREKGYRQIQGLHGKSSVGHMMPISKCKGCGVRTRGKPRFCLDCRSVI